MGSRNRERLVYVGVLKTMSIFVQVFLVRVSRTFGHGVSVLTTVSTTFSLLVCVCARMYVRMRVCAVCVCAYACVYARVCTCVLSTDVFSLLPFRSENLRGVMDDDSNFYPFSSRQYLSRDTNAVHFDVADMNGDSHMDLIIVNDSHVVGQTPGDIYWLENDGMFCVCGFASRELKIFSWQEVL